MVVYLQHASNTRDQNGLVRISIFTSHSLSILISPVSEPCIRGHRATSCKHAHERVMIPVRKPGRPLGNCPHRPGSRKTCGCRDLTVAFPRRHQCVCVASGGPGEADCCKPDASTTQTSAASLAEQRSPPVDNISSQIPRQSVEGPLGGRDVEKVNVLTASADSQLPDPRMSFQQQLSGPLPEANLNLHTFSQLGSITPDFTGHNLRFSQSSRLSQAQIQVASNSGAMHPSIGSTNNLSRWAGVPSVSSSSQTIEYQSSSASQTATDIHSRYIFHISA
jgi:hypothetical protein